MALGLHQRRRAGPLPGRPHGRRRLSAGGAGARRAGRPPGRGSPRRPADAGDLTIGGNRMAWDFLTEPEFEEKLEWMRGFVRDEVIPLETLELDATMFARAVAPL